MTRIFSLNGAINIDYELYSKAYSWDKNNTCFTGKHSKESFGILRQHFAMFQENEFIGYGIHNYESNLRPNIQVLLSYIGHPEDMTLENTMLHEPRKINIAYIINPDYRNLGYGTLLVDYLVKEAEKNTDYDLIEATILKENTESLSLIKKFDFEQKSSDYDKIVFQKTIKKN